MPFRFRDRELAKKRMDSQSGDMVIWLEMNLDAETGKRLDEFLDPVLASPQLLVKELEVVRASAVRLLGPDDLAVQSLDAHLSSLKAELGEGGSPQ